MSKISEEIFYPAFKKWRKRGEELFDTGHLFLRKFIDDQNAMSADPQSDLLRKSMIDKAAKIEPAIIQPHRDAYIASQIFRPSPDYKRFRLMKGVLDIIGEQQYEMVFLLSGWRLGGAEREMYNIIEAIAGANSDKQYLLLATDIEVMGTAPWKELPSSVTVAEFSSIAPTADYDDRAWLIAHLLLTVGAHRVINCNSNAGWLAMTRYGPRLYSNMKTEALLFCYDYDCHGKRAGYVPAFFRDALPFLTAVYIDNQKFIDQLHFDFGLPAGYRQRLKLLYHPYLDSAVFGSNKPDGLDRPAGKHKIGRVLWASRPSKQKAVDLLFKIAGLMPDVQFIVAGGSRRDFTKVSNNTAAPDNIKFTGVYQNFNDLADHGPDAFLYTSQWDGLPNVLIEAMHAGLPVVASIVGGTGELINESTGWPVNDRDNIASYQQAIAEVLTNKELVRTKQTAARALLTTHHSPLAFERQLKELGLIDNPSSQESA